VGRVDGSAVVVVGEVVVARVVVARVVLAKTQLQAVQPRASVLSSATEPGLHLVRQEETLEKEYPKYCNESEAYRHGR
jgi:hypothetical protein